MNIALLLALIAAAFCFAAAENGSTGIEGGAVGKLDSFLSRFSRAAANNSKNKKSKAKKKPKAQTKKKTNVKKKTKRLTVVVIQSYPFVSVRQESLTPKKYQLGIPASSQSDLFDGFCLDLLRLLAEEADLGPLRIRLVKDGKYGKRNGSRWDGLVGEVKRGEADLALAPLTVNAERAEAIHFSPPFFSTDLAVLLKKVPNSGLSSALSFLSVLRWEAWLCLGGTAVAAAAVLCLVSRLSPQEWDAAQRGGQTLGGAKKHHPLATLSNSLWFTLSSGLLRPPPYSPWSVSGRLAAVVWWAFASAAALLCAVQLVRLADARRLHQTATGVRDLLDQGHLDFGFQAAGATERFFEQSENEDVQRVWEHVMADYPESLVPSYEAGIRRVEQSDGDYAFIMEASAAEAAAERLPCQLVAVKANLRHHFFALATKQGSKLSRKLDVALLALLDRGAVDRLRRKWWLHRGRCSARDAQRRTAAPITPDLSGLLWLFALGLAASLVLSALELCVESLRQAKRRRRGLVETLRENVRRCFRGERRVTFLTDGTD